MFRSHVLLTSVPVALRLLADFPLKFQVNVFCIVEVFKYTKVEKGHTLLKYYNLLCFLDNVFMNRVNLKKNCFKKLGKNRIFRSFLDPYSEYGSVSTHANIG